MPKRVITMVRYPHLPEHARDAVMWRNGVEVYKLPTTVPVLEGQTRVF